MTVILFVAMALAAYRATRVISRDTILDGVREKFWPDPDTTKLGELLTCDFCAGFWVSGIVVAATNAVIDFEVPVLEWLAVAGLQALLASWEG